MGTSWSGPFCILLAFNHSSGGHVSAEMSQWRWYLCLEKSLARRHHHNNLRRVWCLSAACGPRMEISFLHPDLSFKRWNGQVAWNPPYAPQLWPGCLGVIRKAPHTPRTSCVSNPSGCTLSDWPDIGLLDSVFARLVRVHLFLWHYTSFSTPSNYCDHLSPIWNQQVTRLTFVVVSPFASIRSLNAASWLTKSLDCYCACLAYLNYIRTKTGKLARGVEKREWPDADPARGGRGGRNKLDISFRDCLSKSAPPVATSFCRNHCNGASLCRMRRSSRDPLRKAPSG